MKREPRLSSDETSGKVELERLAQCIFNDYKYGILEVHPRGVVCLLGNPAWEALQLPPTHGISAAIGHHLTVDNFEIPMHSDSAAALSVICISALDR